MPRPGSHTGTRAHGGVMKVPGRQSSSQGQACLATARLPYWEPGNDIRGLQTWCLLRTGEEVRGWDTGVEGRSVFLVS